MPRAIIIDGPQRLQELLVCAISEAEISIVGGPDHLGALDAMLRIFAEAGKEFQGKPLLALRGALGSVERANGALEITISDDRYEHVRGSPVGREGEIVMINVFTDVKHHRRDDVAAGNGLATIGLHAVIDENADRSFELADAVGAAIEAEFCPECVLEEALDDLVIGKPGSFGAAPGADLGI
jgi:hypothetical protein